MEQVPTSAITMGIQTILQSEEILLLATGEGKAQIIQRTLTTEPNPNIPATSLKTHNSVSFYLDKEARGNV